MSDGYQVGVLSLINVCFSKIYGDDYTSDMSTRLGNALFVGIVLGQVSFFTFNKNITAIRIDMYMQPNMSLTDFSPSFLCYRLHPCVDWIWVLL